MLWEPGKKFDTNQCGFVPESVRIQPGRKEFTLTLGFNKPAGRIYRTLISTIQGAPDDHSQLNGARIEGLTEIGIATVRLLKMNEGDQIEIRAGLIGRSEF